MAQMAHLVPLLSQNACCGWGHWCHSLSFEKFPFSNYQTASIYITSGQKLPPSDVYVRNFLYLFYTLIKLYYTKALSDQASSLAPDWILLQRRRIPASFMVRLQSFNFLSFSMIQQMLLAIWSLVSLPFLNPACTSGSSQFTYCWTLVWRILSTALLACEMSAIVQ